MLPLSDSHKTNTLPLLTYFLIFINIAVFLVEITSPDVDGFITKYAFTPALFSFSDASTWYQLITSAFLHGGFSHILFNLLFLWIFGDNVEESLGSIGFLIFYLGATVSAGLLQYFIDPTTRIPMLGASGAIAGILGYYLIIFPKHTIKTLLFFGGVMFMRELPAQIFLAYWAVTQFFSGFGSLLATSDGGTAWFAHIGGLIFGVLIGLIMSRIGSLRAPKFEIVS